MESIYLTNCVLTYLQKNSFMSNLHRVMSLLLKMNLKTTRGFFVIRMLIKKTMVNLISSVVFFFKTNRNCSTHFLTQ